MTKEEIWLDILKNIPKLSHLNQNLKTLYNKSQRLCISINQTFNNDMPIFKSHRDIRLYFTNEVAKCPICKGDLQLNHDNLKNGFNKFCSNKCEYESISIRQKGENNTCHKFDKIQWKKNLSIALRKAIAEGRFTPNITNSWCHSRREFEMNGKMYKVRSSWEENFWRKNPHLEYEKIRIPYLDITGQKHSYIVDFVDEINKILYEIKPKSIEFIGSIKYRAAVKWAKENGYKFIVIDEDQKN